MISRVLEDEPPPVVQGCPTCGEVFHIVVRYRTRPILDDRVSHPVFAGGRI